MSLLVALLLSIVSPPRLSTRTLGRLRREFQDDASRLSSALGWILHGADSVAGANRWPTAISTEPPCTQLTPSSAERARREHRHPKASTPEELPALDPLENGIRRLRASAGMRKLPTPPDGIANRSLGAFRLSGSLRCMMGIYVGQKRAARSSPQIANCAEIANSRPCWNTLSNLARTRTKTRPHVLAPAGDTMLKRADVVVIGSGGLGAATAFYLAKRNAGTVVLVDRHEIGSQLGGRAYSKISPGRHRQFKWRHKLRIRGRPLDGKLQ
jgi:FAD dependent oxidoreductase